MYGYEDRLLNRLAGVTNVFTSNHLQERIRPVHVIDVGMALENMLHDDTTASQTFELYGPKEYSMAEISELVDKEILKTRRHLNIPERVAKPVFRYLNKALWWPVKTEQDVEREFYDQVIDPKAKTFKDLDIEPVELQTLTYQYLKGYRSDAYYDLPPMTEKERREEKKYLHVLDDQ
jgi:NADH dehydrogenase (ubiquinone) 1 alpha subcomplex subunit 9